MRDLPMRNAGLVFEASDRPQPERDTLLTQVRKPQRDKQTIREVRLRLPEAVVEQLQEAARLNGCSMNAAAAVYLDRGFRVDGFKGIDELAPGFADYLRNDRRGEKAPAVPDEAPANTEKPATNGVLPIKFT